MSLKQRNAEWIKQDPRKRWIIYLACYTMVAVLIGAGWVLVANKALGSTPSGEQRICTHNPDMTCAWSPKKTAYKFRHGYYQRAHGFKEAAWFKHPAAARLVIHRKIVRKLGHMTARRLHRVHRWLAAHLTWGPAPCGPMDIACMATQEFKVLHRKTNCVGKGYYDTTYGMCSANIKDPFSKADVKRGGTVFFCGGAVVLGVVTAPATAGVGVAAVATWGAASCGFTAWALFN